MATLTVTLPEQAEEQARAQTGPPAPKQPSRGDRYAQMFVLTLLLAAPAVMCLHAAVAADPDLWWHLRIGELVARHHTIVRTDPLSRDMAGATWLAYSWLFDGLIFKLFARFGLPGIVGYSTTMVLAVTVALNRLVRRLQPDFIVSALLTYAGCFSMSHLFTPRPWMFSILFFIVVLDVLQRARKDGHLRLLAWLPLVFAVWANLHIEFIYGLFAVGLAFLESLVGAWRKQNHGALRVAPAAATLLGCCLAALANPFGWGIYGAVLSAAKDSGALRLVSEMQAIPFRDPIDFCLLAMALAAVGMLARTRSLPVFESGLLLFAILMSFREQRDEWLLAVVASAILAATIPARAKLREVPLPRFGTAFAAAAGMGLLWIAAHAWKLNETVVQDQMAKILPVRAADYVRQKGYTGPLFNDFNWGGYLGWALGTPVTIDGRTNLYGSDRINRSVATWGGAKDWATDPDLTSSGIVIGPAQSGLIQLLRTDAQFQLVYEDDQAAVFLHRP